jgi:hypothetical protein
MTPALEIIVKKQLHNGRFEGVMIDKELQVQWSALLLHYNMQERRYDAWAESPCNSVGIGNVTKQGEIHFITEQRKLQYICMLALYFQEIHTRTAPKRQATKQPASMQPAGGAP